MSSPTKIENHKAFQDLIIDNFEFDPLEVHLVQFYIFKAFSTVRAELRHFDFFHT